MLNVAVDTIPIQVHKKKRQLNKFAENRKFGTTNKSRRQDDLLHAAAGGMVRWHALECEKGERSVLEMLQQIKRDVAKENLKVRYFRYNRCIYKNKKSMKYAFLKIFSTYVHA